MNVSVQAIVNAFTAMATMPSEQMEGYNPQLEQMSPGVLERLESGTDKSAAEAAALMLSIILQEQATPGNSGDAIKDVADWITASGSKKINVQLGVHFEEVSEMIDELVGINDAADEALANTYDAVVALATQLKHGDIEVYVPNENRHDFLDAICDQIVTGTGAATMLQMQVAEGMRRVNASNWSKYVDGKPLFDANGKIAKGPNYVKADLKGLT